MQVANKDPSDQDAEWTAGNAAWRMNSGSLANRCFCMPEQARGVQVAPPSRTVGIFVGTLLQKGG
jgi:hypothetical protein